MDLNQKLSPNFSLWEFVISQTATRKGIDNTPTEEVVKNIKTLCRTILEPAREALGPIRISSGYRCAALNVAIGGSKTSAHQVGFAADILPVKATKLEFAKWVVANTVFDQVILEFGTHLNPDWIHVSADPRFRKQVLEILKGTAYIPIKIL